MRLDSYLVQQKIAPTKSQAHHLIKDGVILVDGLVCTKPGKVLHARSKVEALESTQYVSRGAKKLKAALEHFNLNPKGLLCADLGASTGGFSQILLSYQVAKIYAVDVGKDQLHPQIKADPRVIEISGVNLRELASLPEKVDFAVVDLSFISLLKVADQILTFLNPKSSFLMLFKPQFEVGAENLTKSGIVKSPEVATEALNSVLDYLAARGVKCQFFKCPVLGQDGNQEFFIYGQLNT